MAKGDPFDKRLGKSSKMVGPGPRTGIPPMAPTTPGMGPPPGTRRATVGPSPLKMKGRPLSAFMPSPKKLKRGKKGQKRLAI